jgi:hypothetical protein
MVVRLVSGHRVVRGNVSVTGVGFELPSSCHLRRGDVVEVRLDLPGESVHVRAVVNRIRRSEPRAVGRIFVGAEILEMDELVLNPLFRFVEEAALLRRPLLPTAQPTSYA